MILPKFQIQNLSHDLRVTCSSNILSRIFVEHTIWIQMTIFQATWQILNFVVITLDIGALTELP